MYGGQVYNPNSNVQKVIRGLIVAFLIACIVACAVGTSLLSIKIVYINSIGTAFNVRTFSIIVASAAAVSSIVVLVLQLMNSPQLQTVSNKRAIKVADIVFAVLLICASGFLAALQHDISTVPSGASVFLENSFANGVAAIAGFLSSVLLITDAAMNK